MVVPLPPMVLCVLLLLPYHVHLHTLFYGKCDSLVSLKYVIQYVFVSCIITMSRSSGTIDYLIEEVIVIVPCAFQCTSLIWDSDLRLLFGDVDRPELEDEKIWVALRKAGF